MGAAVTGHETCTTAWFRAARLMACGLALAAAPGALATGPTQDEVTAAFLFNFSKFVEWPDGTFPSAADPIAICVLGEGSFSALLEGTVRGKQAGGRGISVRTSASLAETGGCHVLFIARSERGRLGEVLGDLATRPVLTVSDAPSGADRGAVIGLKLEERKVRFEINLIAANRAGLKLSSQLLKVAVRLIGQDDPGR